MAYQYPQILRKEDGSYGPTSTGHYYKPAPYHNPTARRSAVKTRWRLTEPQQYEVFRVADEGSEKYSDNNGGLFGFLDQMNEILGKDNEERIAHFPSAVNPWHGYPINSVNIDDDIIDRWKTAGMIGDRIYRHLLKHSI